MDKPAAVKIIRDTFERPFEKGQFTHFTRNLLNHLDTSGNFSYHGNYIPDAYEQSIQSYDRIGKYEDADGNKIDVLIVRLKNGTSLERARTRQRNFIARYLEYGRKGNPKDAALVAVVSHDSKDWRFSLVKMEYNLVVSGDKVKGEKTLTPARRYSFLVGENESSHTAQSQLVDILADDRNNPTLSGLENAFSIEVVTKEFFRKYRDLFLKVKEALQKVVEQDKRVREDFAANGVDTVNFAKKLLGQVVFLYFLQKKGWLGVPENESWGDGDRKFLRTLFSDCQQNKSSYFNDYLEHLFYDALNNQSRGGIDPSYYPRFGCRIPFLNGGLFDPIDGYDWVRTDILLSNELFSNTVRTKEGDVGTGILDVFDRYNFTVKEDEPLEKEVAVDPEMLGKVFENLLEVKDRKSKGTYYTPREIVHYMCQESLINYLDTAINTDDVALVTEKPTNLKLFGTPAFQQQALKTPGNTNRVPREDIEILVRKGELVTEHDARVESKGKETKDYSYKLPISIRNNAKLIDDKLSDIRVCDPAIGSGAFPVGTMTEIVRARNTLKTYLPDNGKRTSYYFKRHCIQNCLYGVDIDPGAVEIAKLRLWLSLVVDEEDIKHIKPLPNLDYKIMQGNSLLSEFMGIDLDNMNNHNGKQLGFRDETDILMQNLEKKKDKLHNEFHAGEKENLRQEIEELIIKIFEARLQKQESGYFEQIRKIEEKYKPIPNQKQREEGIKQEKERLYKRSGFDREKIKQQLREYTSGHKIRPFFPWKLYFSEVFHEKGGFDVVIANPPYLRQESLENKEYFKNNFCCYHGMADLYTYFIERSFFILREKGIFSYIVSNRFTHTNYGKNLRCFLGKKDLLGLINLNGVPVFEKANVDTVLILASNRSSDDRELLVCNIEYSSKYDVSIDEYVRTYFKHSAKRYFNENPWSFQSDEILEIRRKIENRGKGLSQIRGTRINRGITTGLNSVFIINEDTRNRILRIDPSSNALMRPIAKGEHIKRWSLRWSNSYLIYTYTGVEKKKYPGIFDHLSKFKHELENVYEAKHGKKKWFELRGCNYYSEFEKEKIIYTRLSNINSFALSTNGEFCLDSAGIIVTNDNKYYCAILNSRLIYFYFKLVSVIWGKDGIKWFGNSFDNIPIFEIDPSSSSEVHIHDSIISLVDQILAITKGEDYLSNPVKQAKVKELEHQIDRMVYELYGLTPEEIAVVEGNSEHS